MGLNSLEMHFTDKAAPYIEAAGGKMGGLDYLRIRVPQLAHAILPIQVIKHGEHLTNLTVPAGEDGRYIFRGSDQRDFQGLVDVLKTEVGDEKEAPHLVGKVQEQARLPEVLAYGQYENPGFKGKIAVGIQPYFGCQRGSIVEHPNRPNNYVISFVPEGYQTGIGGVVTGMYNAETGDYKQILGLEDTGLDKRTREIVELYRLIDSADLVKPGYSFQMEFLNSKDGVFIAQVRAFMKKQLAGFELDATQRLVFGITPPNGVILPVFLSTDGFLSGDYPDYRNPWAYLKFCEDRKSDFRELLRPANEEERTARALRFNPRNLAAYLIGQSFGSQVNTGLEHNHFRFAQKADLTVFEGIGSLRHNFTRLFLGKPGELPTISGLYGQIRERAQMEHKSLGSVINEFFEGRLKRWVKIVCDGRTAIVEPVTPRGKRIFKGC